MEEADWMISLRCFWLACLLTYCSPLIAVRTDLELQCVCIRGALHVNSIYVLSCEWDWEKTHQAWAHRAILPGSRRRSTHTHSWALLSGAFLSTCPPQVYTHINTRHIKRPPAEQPGKAEQSWGRVKPTKLGGWACPKGTGNYSCHTHIYTWPPHPLSHKPTPPPSKHTAPGKEEPLHSAVCTMS